MENVTVSKPRRIAAWLIAGALTALYLFSAFGKLTHPEQMAPMHLDAWALIIGIGEIGSALLFLIPKTNKYGTLLLSSYMGGAIIVHMSAGMSIMFPSVVLFLVWIVAFLRNDDLLRL